MDPTVEVGSGRIRGTAHGEVVAFLGVPFARPPLGPRRFRAPEPPVPWTGVRDATAFGIASAQSELDVSYVPGFSLWTGVGRSGEDCLHLNVWAPAGAGPHPVLVWLHGGAFLKGSGGQDLYRGDALARRGAVVVTVNYRLGALGFLHLDDERFTPNAGLLDQLAALRWVQDHVAAFGGDPGNITVFGESAGAMSVGDLLVAPAAAGLFHRAVAQSGLGRRTPAAGEGVELAERFLAHAGLDRGRAGELFELPVERILSAQVKVTVDVRRADMGAGFQPTLDGAVLDTPVLDGVAAGRAAGVPLLAGTNEHEMNLWRVLEPGLRDLDEAGLAARAAALLGGPGAGGAAVEAYRAGRPGAPPAELWQALWTDREFRLPALRALEAHCRHEAATFAYLFTRPSPTPGIGACHAIEVPYVFGTLDSPGADVFAGSDPRARALSARMQEAWLRFARGGDPGWERFEPRRRATMVLGDECAVIDDPHGAERRAWDGHPAA